MPELTILLPTYNEEDNIELILAETLNVFKNTDCEILVVDGNSTDKTRDIANKFAKNYQNVKIINYPERGKAKAIAHVMQTLNSSYVIMYDVDQSYLVQDAFKIYEELKKGKDYVIGNRLNPQREKDSINLVNLFGNYFLSLSASFLYQRVSDVCSGLIGLSKAAYKNINIDSKHFELEINIFIECTNNKINAHEIPIKYKKRKGTSKILIFDGIKIFLYMLKKKFLDLTRLFRQFKDL